MSADDSLLGAQGDTAGAGGSGDGGASGGTPPAQDTGQQGAAGGAQGEAQGQAGGDDSLLGVKAAEGDKQAEGDKDKEGDKQEGDKDADAVTPESYGDFTTPEGMPVNPEILGEFKAVAAELKLPKEAAQKLVDLQVKNAQAQLQQWKDVRDGWVKDLKADKDLGGDKFDQTIHKANMALRQFDPEGGFLKALKGTFDNHPETIKFLTRVHEALGEDAVHTSREAGKGKEVPLHDRLWSKEDMGFGVNT